MQNKVVEEYRREVTHRNANHILSLPSQRIIDQDNLQRRSQKVTNYTDGKLISRHKLKKQVQEVSSLLTYK